MYNSTLDRPPVADQPGVRRPTRFSDTDKVVASSVGILAGLTSAVYVYLQVRSLELAFFVFVQVSYLLGMGLVGVISSAHHIQRALYLLLLPVISVVVLAGVYNLWGHLWLAVIAGIIVGGLFHTLAGWAFFPQVKHEQREQRREARANW